LSNGFDSPSSPPPPLVGMGNLKSIISRNPSPSPSHDSVLTWSLASNLQPSERAAFAVTSRLLASIVTESLLRSYYVPINSEEALGICVILSTNVVHRILRPADVFAIIPLHQKPIVSGTTSTHGQPIWLLDPLDMVPDIFELSTQDIESHEVVCLRHIPFFAYAPSSPFFFSHLYRSQFYLPLFPPHGG